MYIPKFFAETRIEHLHDFIGSYPLGLVVTSDFKHGTVANLIPVSLDRSLGKGVLRMHFAKANLQLENFKQAKEILVVFTGPNAYVTPESYPSKKLTEKVVPTWNYTMVQVRGSSRVIEDPQWILKQINELTNTSEAAIQGVWKVSDAPEDFINSQLKLLVGLEIEITSIEGKFKVSQNQSEENRNGVEQYFKDKDSAMAKLVANKGAIR